MHLHGCAAYPPPKYIAQCDNAFGGLPNFLLPNPLKVKNVVGDYLAIEIWEKVKTENTSILK
jgi:hypothetical protein